MKNSPRLHNFGSQNQVAYVIKILFNAHLTVSFLSQNFLLLFHSYWGVCTYEILDF